MVKTKPCKKPNDRDTAITNPLFRIEGCSCGGFHSGNCMRRGGGVRRVGSRRALPPGSPLRDRRDRGRRRSAAAHCIYIARSALAMPSGGGDVGAGGKGGRLRGRTPEVCATATRRSFSWLAGCCCAAAPASGEYGAHRHVARQGPGCSERPAALSPRAGQTQPACICSNSNGGDSTPSPCGGHGAQDAGKPRGLIGGWGRGGVRGRLRGRACRQRPCHVRCSPL